MLEIEALLNSVDWWNVGIKIMIFVNALVFIMSKQYFAEQGDMDE